MVRAIVFISAVVAALIASVSAAPTCGSACDYDDALIDVDGGQYIGIGDIDAEGLGQGLISADNLHVHDVVQDVDVLSDDDDIMYGGGSGGYVEMGGDRRSHRPIRHPDYESGHGCGDSCHHGGLLGGLLKREEAPAAKMTHKAHMNKKKN